MSLPRSLSSIQGPGRIGPQAPGKAPQEEIKGSWKGRTLQLAPSASADAAQQAALQGTAFAPAQQKTLGQRSVGVDRGVLQLTPAQIQAYSRNLVADPRAVRSMARDILCGRDHLAGPGRRGATTRFLALQLARNALDGETSDADLIARLSPVRTREGREHPTSAQEFIELIGDDPGEVRDLLAEILDDKAQDDENRLPDDAHELHSLLRRLLNSGGADALMQRIGKAQGLPPAAEVRQQLREYIDNELRELGTSSQGSLILASLNAAEAAADAGDAPRFLDAYTALTHERNLTFARGGLLLLEHFTSKNPQDTAGELKRALANLKKALADDLNAATPSREHAQLHDVNARLAMLHQVTTLVEWIARASTRVMKVQGKEPPLADLAMLRGLLEILRNEGALASGFIRLRDDCGVREGRASVVFFNEIKTMLRELHDSILAEHKTRVFMIDAVQDALDEAIDLLEAQEDGESALDDPYQGLPDAIATQLRVAPALTLAATGGGRTQ